MYNTGPPHLGLCLEDERGVHRVPGAEEVLHSLDQRVVGGLQPQVGHTAQLGHPPGGLPAAPRQVEDDGELLLAEEAAAVLQAGAEVVVVNEHELHPEVEPQPRLGSVEGLGQPDEDTRSPEAAASLRSPVEQQRPLRGLHHHEQPSIGLCQRQPRHGADWAQMGKWQNIGQTTFIQLKLEKDTNEQNR